MKKRLFISAGVILLASVLLGLFLFTREAEAPTPVLVESERNEAVEQAAPFNKTKYSTTEPASLWVIVNKNRPISLEYEPTDLVTPNVQRDPKDSAKEQQVRKETATVVEALFAEAKSQGINLLFASGYRSSALQTTYYSNYVKRDGQAAADRYSARPGTSEHQTGLAFDLSRVDRKCYLEACFADTPEGKWLAENAPRFGLILRYPAGKESVTGYQYEPWHFRYVGTELAGELIKSGETMEEFFGL